MALPTTPYKGARDFYPQDFKIRKYIFDTWVKVCESYGYEQYDSSIIEPLDLYQAKTSQEIVSEQTYEFTDRGGRRVTLRPEMTPSVSRMVAARRQELSFPLRWFSIPNVWRYERPQRGRLREHWQLNVDLFGIENITADFEIIDIADNIMQAFGAERGMYEIKINSRQLINYLLKENLGLNDELALETIRLIDRKNKMPEDAFRQALWGIIGDKEESLRNLLNVKSVTELPDSVKQIPSYKKLEEVFGLLGSKGVSNAKFDITLMRGFDYYTDIIFEVYDTDPQNNRSLFGGGRYDGLVGLFGVEPVATVGFGMGDVTIKDFIETHSLQPMITTSVEATIVPVDVDYEQLLPILSSVRQQGLKVSVDSSNRKLDKKLKSIAKSNVKYALIIGSEELSNGWVTVKNMHNSLQDTISIDNLKVHLTDK